MMNDDRLKIYVNDHLALLVAETELAQRCHGSNQDGALGLFLQQLVGDLLIEQDVLKEMLRSVGGSESLIKQGMACLAEKAGRFKLNYALLEYSDLSRLVELETLGVGAAERMSFWENLRATRGADTRLSHVDFAERHEQAQRHYDVLGKHRLEAATAAL
mgnify:CR=1 FL=1